MTWQQFKEWAKRHGVRDEDVLAYIDFPSDGPDTVTVLSDDLKGSRTISIS